MSNGSLADVLFTRERQSVTRINFRHIYITHKWIWIGAALLVMVLCILRRKLFSGEINLMVDRSTGDVNGLQNDGKMGNNLTVFSYASVVAATTNFSEENKLGQGGFGPVYKGKELWSLRMN
ncbi:unnamed protein product [Prunus armeniaca]|uniref:Uncharacterized protein n=1 Tax=Prunus armeniaca TaxID=36596 RepID=A0A6J5VC61_PRUAR|nr:unnamed protein product [Prunus armeniaca]CAB4313902.1 unnamed protein product [Prunus armeniaca]